MDSKYRFWNVTVTSMLKFYFRQRILWTMQESTVLGQTRIEVIFSNEAEMSPFSKLLSMVVPEVVSAGDLLLVISMQLWTILRWICDRPVSCNERHKWWRHQMETFSALLDLCAGNSPVTGEFPSQMPVTRSFGVFFDLRLNERLSKQSRRRWFETLWRSLWRHCNAPAMLLSNSKAVYSDLYIL